MPQMHADVAEVTSERIIGAVVEVCGICGRLRNLRSIFSATDGRLRSHSLAARCSTHASVSIVTSITLDATSIAVM